MSAPAITLGSDATLASVISLLESRAISAVPLVDGGRLVGIVSTTDAVGALPGGDYPPVAARDRMTSPVITAHPDEPLDEAARRLVQARVHRLVVVDDDDAVVGVLSARDVLAEVKRQRIRVPIERIMTTTVESVDIGDTIEEAIRRLSAARVHGVVVVDGSFPVGVFTHTEALAARKLPAALRAGPVEEVMSYETVCLDLSTPIYRAAAYAISMDLRRVLVVHDRKLVGILSPVDLVRVIAEPLPAA